MTGLHEKGTVGIEDEMQQSYLDYAMSVIVGRALPELRDGLKPVHRRILYAMSKGGNAWNRPYRKAAKVVGEVMGLYHPHGDAAIYDSVVRMAQPFSMRYPFIDGQGNFGSVDGDPPAAMRYTEVRMHRICQALLDDIDKQTVDFVPNYDNNEEEPTVLPARFPVSLSSHGSQASRWDATNIPPTTSGRSLTQRCHLLRNPDATVVDLMGFVPARIPDRGYILGRQGVIEAYNTGRGSVPYGRRSKSRTQRERIRAHCGARVAIPGR